MDYEEAKTLIENALHTYVRLNSTQAASKCFDKELAKLLAALLGRKPTKETIEEINAYLKLEEDWDGEDALPVAPETGNLARNLVQQIACGMGERQQWVFPSISPDSNGHLHLLWRMGSHRLLLLVDGEKIPKTIVSVVTPLEGKPTREEISFQEAVRRVLSALPTK